MRFLPADRFRRRRVREPEVTLDRLLLVGADPDVGPDDFAAALVPPTVYDPERPHAGRLEGIAAQIAAQRRGGEAPDRRWHAVMTFTNGARLMITPGHEDVRGVFTAPGESVWRPVPSEAAGSIADRLVSALDVNDPELRAARAAVFTEVHAGVVERWNTGNDLFVAVTPGQESTTSPAHLWAHGIAPRASRSRASAVSLDRAVVGVGLLVPREGVLEVHRAYDPGELRPWHSVAAQAAVHDSAREAAGRLGRRGASGDGRHALAGFAVNDGRILIIGAGDRPAAVIRYPTRSGWRTHGVAAPTARVLAENLRDHLSATDVDLTLLRERMTPAVRDLWNESAPLPATEEAPGFRSPLDPFTDAARAARSRAAARYRRHVARQVVHYMPAWIVMEGGVGAFPLVADLFEPAASTAEIVGHGIATVAIPLAAAAGVTWRDMWARPTTRRRIRVGQPLALPDYARTEGRPGNGGSSRAIGG